MTQKPRNNENGERHNTPKEDYESGETGDYVIPKRWYNPTDARDSTRVSPPEQDDDNDDE